MCDNCESGCIGCDTDCSIPGNEECQEICECKKNQEDKTMDVGVKIKLITSPEVIKDNLERIGIVNRKEKILYPSCYLLKKNEEYYICHFKELLKENRSEETDIKRRNTIIWLFKKWGLLDVEDSKIKNIQKKKLFILTNEQRNDDTWEIKHKYHYMTKK